MKRFSWLAGVMLVLLSWMPAQATDAGCSQSPAKSSAHI